MRVVLAGACPFPTPQGSQVYLRGMARALAAAGCDVTVVVYGHGDPASASLPAADARDAAFRTLRIPRLPGYGRLRSGPDLVKPALDLLLAARVAALPADVVVAHNAEALAAALLARARTGVPVVYAAHTLLGDELPAYFSRARPAWAAAGRAADRLLAPRADAVLALSPLGAAAFRALGCRRVHLAPMGLDPADYAGVLPRRLGPRPTVVYAGNVDAYQDLPVLAAAAALLPDVDVVVVGPDAPPGLPPAGRGVAATSALRWVPARAWTDARDWIAGADAAVVPRRSCAGLPVKLLNALALGVPTVVTRGCAQGLAGEVVVAAGDPGALAAGVRLAFTRSRPDSGAFLASWGWPAAARRVQAVLAEVVEPTANRTVA